MSKNPDQYEQPHFDGIEPSPYVLPLGEKVDLAVKTLRLYEETALRLDGEDGYFGCFSGGKDSIVVKRLADMAGVRVKWWYSVTTVDPPELVRFIKREHPDVEFIRPKMHMWTRAVEKRMLPLKNIRWCCAEYKEPGGIGRVKLTGIRAAESVRRKARWNVFSRWSGSVETWVCNPAYYWTDADVWRFIRDEDIPYCSLYDDGFDRLGCLGCPMDRNRRAVLERYPGYMRGWRRAANRAFERLKADGCGEKVTRAFATGDEWFEWWLSNDAFPTEGDDGCDMGWF